MARQNQVKTDSNRISYNTRTHTVMANMAQDNIKEKVNAVREVVSGRSNDEIVLVLQFYENNVERVIQAYLEDGAKEALTEWHYSGTKPIKKKRNKKKNQATPDSVSSESGLATNQLLNGDAKEHLVNGTTNLNVTDVKSSLVITHDRVSPVLIDEKETQKIEMNQSVKTTVLPHQHVPITSTEPLGSKVKVKENVVIEKSPSPLHQRQHHDNRHRTQAGSYRNRTTSTSSTGGEGKTAKKPPTHVLERSSKDLHRQTVSLERLRLVFNEEVDKSYKRIKSVFDEIRNCLNKREAELIGELNTARDIGRDTFSMRQGRASELKVNIDRAEKMNETELAELRSEIKNFVSDRKIDEDLGRNTRFTYADDNLKSNIIQFGEVTPVKCIYIQRHPSLSSVESGAPSESEPLSHLTKSADSATLSVKVEKKKDDIPHLDSAQTHEIAELQRRLKHSLTLEGIPVQTYQERPVSVPLPETNSAVTNSTARPTTANSRNNKNRRRGGPGRGGRPVNNQDRKERPYGEGRGQTKGYIQGADGERIILIGKGTRPQSGPGQPSSAGGSGSGAPRASVAYRGGRGRGQGNTRSSSNESPNNLEKRTENGNKSAAKGEKSSFNRRPNPGKSDRRESPRQPVNSRSPKGYGDGNATKPAGLEQKKESAATITINTE